MTTEEAIFAEASAKGSLVEQAAYLDRACAGDSQLRAQVEALLSAHQRAEGILEVPPAGLEVTREPVSESRGSTIGPYKLLEQIGEGGMAVVFLAEQTRPLKRKVALKIIKPGMDSRQVITRFEAERQALALMDHPNIAKVLEAGTTASRQPYFVMELVKGLPITKYCDEHHVDPRQRLELFAQVCSAVQHAHTKGIIHRDLKPSNVLVALYDGKPVPKVIDFGIAKATGQPLTERTMFTGFGHVVGTPEYMSPEQAEMNQLDIDTRSDVYSLGVLLYELLTGSTPLDSKHLKERALMEVLRVIREEEPPKPSTRLSTTEQLPSIAASRGLEPRKLSVLVRGELDWIVMKALEKDRTRRYETANGLASDVQRYLSDEPVHACPPSARYRFGKLVRRHRLELGVAAGFILLLVAATVVSSWQALRARRAESLAQLRLQAESEARAQAVTEAAKATTISDLLLEMFTSANPDQVKGADYTVRQLLNDSAQRLGDQLKAQPEVEAAVRAAIGNAYRRLVMTDQAEPHLQRALALRRELAAKAGNAGDAQELVAQSLLDYGWNLYMSKRATDAERYLRESVAIYKANGVRSVKAIEALCTLQLCLDNQLRFREAEVVANEALSLGRQLFPDGHGEIANVLHRLAGMKQAEGDLDAAEPLAREAIIMHRRWHGEEHPETAWSLLIQGDLFFKLAKYSEAADNCREALAIFGKQYDPSHEVVLNALNKLERALVAEGDQAALAAFRAEKAVRLSNALARGADLLNARSQLARFLRDAGSLDQATTQFSELAELAKASAPDLRRALADDCAKLAILLRDKQKLPEAEKAFRHAISLREPLTKEAPPSLRLAQSNSYNDLAFVLLPAKRLPEAEEAVRSALAMKHALALEFPDNPDYRIHLAHSYLGLCHITVASGRMSEALHAVGEARNILERLAAEPSPTEGARVFLAHTCWQLADAWLSVKRLEEAERANQNALALFRSLSSDFPRSEFYRQEQGFTHRKLADVAHRADRIEDAEGHLRHSLDFYVKLVAATPDRAFYRQEATYAALALADLHTQLGDWRNATHALTQAVKTSVPGDHNALARLALLRLALHDEPGYRTACLTLLQQSLSQQPKGNAAFEIAWSCVLLPDAGVDAAHVVRVAEGAVAVNAKDPDYLIALGAALYRAARFDEAAKTLADAEAAYRREEIAPSAGIYVMTTIIYSQLFLAMTHHQRGDHDEAARWLARAGEAIDRLKPASRSLMNRDWKRQLTIEILRNEAEALAAARNAR